MIIKYDAEGKTVWGASVGGTSDDKITAIAETSDGGIVVGGIFDSWGLKLDNNQVLKKSSGIDGMIIKYDADGRVLWGASVGGTSDDEINAIAETSDGEIVVGGRFNSWRIDLDNGQVLENKNARLWLL